jgi:hypothetical protein
MSAPVPAATGPGDDGETLDPRYGEPHALGIEYDNPIVHVDGAAYPVPVPVWEALGQLLHSDIQLKKKIRAFRAQAGEQGDRP